MQVQQTTQKISAFVRWKAILESYILQPSSARRVPRPLHHPQPMLPRRQIAADHVWHVMKTWALWRVRGLRKPGGFVGKRSLSQSPDLAGVAPAQKAVRNRSDAKQSDAKQVVADGHLRYAALFRGANSIPNRLLQLETLQPVEDSRIASPLHQ